MFVGKSDTGMVFVRTLALILQSPFQQLLLNLKCVNVLHVGRLNESLK